MIIERQKRLKKLMRNSNIEGLVLFPGVDFFYASGLNVHTSERLTAFILPFNGDPVLICPSFERTRMEKGLNNGNIRVWEEDEKPFDLFAGVMRELELEDKRIALDNKLWFEWFLKIRKAIPTAEFKDTSSTVQEARLIKTEEEIKIMRKAAELSSDAIINTFEQVETGMSEVEIAKIVREELEKKGKPAFGLILSGKNSALPHGVPGDSVIEKNDVLLIDAGLVYRGYYGDITITSIMGEPSPKFKKLYEIVFQANRTAFEKSKAGNPAETVDISARKIITKEGYGQNFTHRVGHGIGIEGHERPYMVNGNKLILKENMCHTIEPGIYLEGEFGVRIEDDVVVRKNRCEFLYEVPRRIWEFI